MTLKNTDSEYIIKVINRQKIDGEENIISEEAPCRFYEKNGKQYVLYTVEDDGEKTSVIIKIGRDIVSIKRSGTVNSNMEYIIGRKQNFLYKLPWGAVEMELETERIISSLTRGGGIIKLVYTLLSQGEKYFNNMEIIINKR